MSRRAPAHRATPKEPRRRETPRQETPRQETPRRRWPRVVLVGVLVVVTLGFGVQWILHRSYFSAEHVLITGNVHESYAEVLARSGLATHPPLIDVNPGAVTTRVESFRWVERAVVTRKWPNTVTVAVTERVPVAVAHQGHQLFLVDGSGHRLDAVAVSTTYPLLETTPPTTTLWPYTRWAEPAAVVAARLPRAFASQVARISVTRAGDVTMTLTSPLTFVLGPATQLQQKFISIAAVIAHGTLHAGDVVDVSVPGTLTVSGPQ